MRPQRGLEISESLLAIDLDILRAKSIDAGIDISEVVSRGRNDRVNANDRLSIVDSQDIVANYKQGSQSTLHTSSQLSLIGNLPRVEGTRVSANHAVKLDRMHASNVGPTAVAQLVDDRIEHRDEIGCSTLHQGDLGLKHSVLENMDGIVVDHVCGQECASIDRDDNRQIVVVADDGCHFSVQCALTHDAKNQPLENLENRLAPDSRQEVVEAAGKCRQVLV